MSVIADLIRAGVDPELVGRVSEELAAARAAGAAEAVAPPMRTARQERNHRYYERLRASENKTNKTIKTLSDADSLPLAKEGSPTPPKKTQPLPPTSLRSVGDNGGASRRAKIEPDAQPGDAEKQAAVDAGLSPTDFRAEWVAFRDHHLGKGTMIADRPATWRTWLRSPYRTTMAKASNGHHARAGPPPPDQIRKPMIAAIQRRFERQADEPGSSPSDQHFARAHEH